MTALRTPKFIYFDLGNVLLHFDHAIMCRQMAEVASTSQREVTAQHVREVVFESKLEDAFETGELSGEAFHARFCEATQTSPSVAALEQAASDIFWPNHSILPVLGALIGARAPIGILSNINVWHWQFISNGRYRLIPGAFAAAALSFQIHAMKPSAAIYARAADLAGFAPEEIFYVDDLADNVVAARQAGFDSVQYTSTHDLASELRRRGVGMNY